MNGPLSEILAFENSNLNIYMALRLVATLGPRLFRYPIDWKIQFDLILLQMGQM